MALARRAARARALVRSQRVAAPSVSLPLFPLGGRDRDEKEARVGVGHLIGQM